MDKTSKIYGITILKNYSIRYKEYLLVIFFAIVYRLVLHEFLFDAVVIENDSVTYQNLALRIANFNLSGYSGERSPGYPIFLLVANNSVVIAVLLQHILGVITAIFWFKTIKNFQFSAKNSIWITFFLQSFLNVYFYESVILVESLCLFFISILFWWISNDFFKQKKFETDLLMGFVLAYLTLIKPFLIFIPFLIYGFIVLNNFKLKKPFQTRIILLVVPLITFFSWSYVNKINTGTFTSSTYLGFNMAQNVVYFAEKGPKKYDWIYKPLAKRRDLIRDKGNNESAAMAIWEIYTIGVYDYKGLSFVQLSNELGNYALETIKNNPKDYAKQVLTKSWWNFWKVSGAMESKYFKSENRKLFFNAYWFLQRKLFNFFKFGFMLLVPFYFFQFIKNKQFTIDFLVVTIIFVTSVLQALVTYGTNSRYSFPFEYLMILMGLIFIKNNIKLPKFLSKLLQ